jgi:hypothetical protein
MRYSPVAVRSPLRRIWPLVVSGLLLAGCDQATTNQTAEFPKVPKIDTTTKAPLKPAPGMDRVGSDAMPSN